MDTSDTRLVQHTSSTTIKHNNNSEAIIKQDFFFDIHQTGNQCICMEFSLYNNYSVLSEM